MNSEIIGSVTDVPWAFIFERVDTYPRHPGQLYEAIAYLVFFILILVIYKRQPRKVGSGLFFGAELVLDRAEKTPAPDIATRIINEMRERGVLMGKLGVQQNATKIRPPMPFSKDNADLMLSALDDVLAGL